MHHWTFIEILCVLGVLLAICGIVCATIAAFALPFLQQKSLINVSFLAAAGITGSTQKARLSAAQIILSILSLAIVGCLFYGFFVEPYQLQIHTMEIKTSKLSNTSIRVVQFSDVHSDDVARLEDKIKTSLSKLHPDVIVFTGDAVNMRAGLPNFKSVLKCAADIAPTYVAKGDWDFSFIPPLDYFGGTGAHELYGTAVQISKGSDSIWLGGVPIGSSFLVPAMLSKIPSGAYTVFAYHEPYPDVLPAGAKVDLFLAGHTHGGQVVFPIAGALVTRSKYGTRYLSGMYNVGNMQMYVNRGVGMEGHFPRVRFLSPPEIAVFDVVPLH